MLAVPTSVNSSRVVRRRLNRGGNRYATRALHMICMRRVHQDRLTRVYAAKRIAPGKSKREIMRAPRAASPARAKYPAHTPPTDASPEHFPPAIPRVIT